MRIPGRISRCCLSACLAVSFMASMTSIVPAQQCRAGLTLYNADLNHSWNRLHQALFVRIGPDGKRYGQDRLEPLFWPASKHLLESRSHQRALRALDGFLDKYAEQQIDDPLKRAVLQRDLWLVFNWVESPHQGFVAPQLDSAAVKVAREQLLHRLARVIDRLALTHQEINDLPDNYSVTVSAGGFLQDFNPQRSDGPYLPPQLLSDNGPWVCVGRRDGRTAPRHIDDSYNRFTNSAFFVLLKLPAGRQATIDHMQRLLASDQPLLVPNLDPTSRRQYPYIPNAKIRQFPSGTEFALVRRAMLIDTSHRVVASPLTESIQLRVVHGDIGKLTAQVCDDPAGYFQAIQKQVESTPSFQEFRLSRRLLFSGRGGLQAVADDEVDFKTGFRAHTWDEFERTIRPDQSFHQLTQPRVKQLCIACHSLPGVFSFNSLKADLRFAMLREDGDRERPLAVAVKPMAKVAAAAVKWKESRPNWEALKMLWDD